MSDQLEQSKNAQVTPAVDTAPAPASTGPTVEELKAQLDAEKAAKAELERAREGLIKDLQKERGLRQTYEQRLAPTPAPSPAPQTDVEGDELYKVVAPVIEKHPVVQAAKQLVEQTAADKAAAIEANARKFLEDKTGKKWADIEADTELQTKLMEAVRKYGGGKDLYETTVKAYENWQRDEELERYRKADVERKRATTANEVSSLPAGTPPIPAAASKEFSAAEFNRLSTEEFDQLSAVGTFRKDKDSGKFIYTKL